MKLSCIRPVTFEPTGIKSVFHDGWKGYILKASMSVQRSLRQEKWHAGCVLSQSRFLIQHANEGSLWRRAPALNEWAGLWSSFDSGGKNHDFHFISYKREIKRRKTIFLMKQQVACKVHHSSSFKTWGLCSSLVHKLILYPAHCTCTDHSELAEAALCFFFPLPSSG